MTKPMSLTDEKAVEVMARAHWDAFNPDESPFDDLSANDREMLKDMEWEAMQEIRAAGAEIVFWRPISEAPMDTQLLLTYGDGGLVIGESNGDGTFDDGDYKDHMDGFTQFAILRGPQEQTP